jgi:hypothetical protein
MFERRHEPLLSRVEFLWRMFSHIGMAVGIILGSLMVGILGYHCLEGMAWIDSLLNASMILGGMGPIGEMRTTSGKIFASCYALYSGIVFLVVAGVLFAPMIHRLLHHFHLEIEAEDQSVDKTEKWSKG